MTVRVAVVGQSLGALHVEKICSFRQLRNAKLGNDRGHLLSSCLAVLLGVDGLAFRANVNQSGNKTYVSSVGPLPLSAIGRNNWTH